MRSPGRRTRLPPVMRGLGVMPLVGMAGLLCTSGLVSLPPRAFADDLTLQGFRELFPDESRKLDEFDQRISGWLDRLRGKPSSAPDGQDTYVPPDWMKEVLKEPVPILKSREEILALERADLNRAKSIRASMIKGIQDGLRSFVAGRVDLCRTAIATGDQPRAHSACGDAELAFARCRSQIEPELQKRSAALTARFVPYFGAEGNFTQYDVQASCDVMLKGLDDPARMLREANLRLPETSCHQHIDRLRTMALGGTVPNRMGPDDATVEGYRAFISRNCGPVFEQEAWKVISDATHASEQQRQLQRASLPRRSGGDGSNLVARSVAEVQGGGVNLATVDAGIRRKQQQAIEQSGRAGAQADGAMASSIADLTAQRIAEMEAARREQEIAALNARLAQQQAQADAQARAQAAAQQRQQQQRQASTSPSASPPPSSPSSSSPSSVPVYGTGSGSAGKQWVGTVTNCVTFARLPASAGSTIQYYSYTNGCPERVKVCDNMSGTYWECGFDLDPGETDKTWSRIEDVTRNGGRFVACRAKDSGKDVYFDKVALNCYRSP